MHVKSEFVLIMFININVVKNGMETARQYVAKANSKSNIPVSIICNKLITFNPIRAPHIIRILLNSFSPN